MYVNDFHRLRLGDAETTIVNALARSLVIVSLGQIATTFFRGDRANAGRSVRRLLELKLVTEHKLLTRTPPSLKQPIAKWTPGKDAPSPFRLSYCLNQRWLTQGTRVRHCIASGPALKSMLGIPFSNRPPRPIQASHDLGLSELYFHFYRIGDDRWKRWIGETYYRNCAPNAIAPHLGPASQRPDAFILARDEQIDCVLEYGGVYNAKRIQKLHRWCQRERISYELW